MRAIAIGEPLGNIKAPIEEGTKLDIDDDGLIFRIAYRNPADDKISDVRDGQASFTVTSAFVGIVITESSTTVDTNVIFFLSKFGKLPWMSTPYNINLSAPGVTVPEVPDTAKTGIELTTVLVDAETGVVKALRIVNLPTSVSQRIRNLVDIQRNLPFDKQRYYNGIKRVKERLSINDLLKQALSS